MNESKYPPHPAAQAFPLMEGEAFARLVQDIKDNGLRESIVLAPFEGSPTILDGRNRERASLEAGVAPRYRHYEGDNPIAFVISANLSRRHMNEGQRALVANRLALLERGRPSESGTSAGLTQSAAAQLLNVGERTVREARTVQRHAEPEVVQAIEQGKISLSKAAEIASLTKEQQIDALDTAKHSEPTRRTKEQRDGMMSIAVLLRESEVMALRTLVEAGEFYAERDARAREGVRVLHRLAPMVRR